MVIHMILLILAFAIFIFIIAVICSIIFYNKTTYRKVTGNSFFKAYFDAGARGEYEIYRKLKFLEKKGCRFLFNIYLPRGNNGTTECDVILIAPKAIIVFESKNYSGWIFGNEKRKMWTQTLPQGKGRCHKEHFFNPVWQNKLHIKQLKNLIGDNIPVYSVIAFSERCVLKDVTVYSRDIHVINRYDIAEAVGNIFNAIEEPVLSPEKSREIYDLLYPYSQVSGKTKLKHIEDINKRL